MIPPPSGTLAVGVDGSLDDCALDLLRERHRSTTGEFHLQRTLHDLKNHFHAIELRVTFLEAEQRDALVTPSVLHELSQCCRSARERIDALQYEPPAPARTPARVELQPIVAQAAALALRDRGVASIATAVASLPPVRAFEDELGVVFVHLFDNAREANGSVHVDGAADDLMVTVRVSDDGAGIPEHVGAKIWKPFFTTKGPSHQGHGLAFVRESVRRAGGSIEFEPTSRGTSFAIKLAR